MVYLYLFPCPLWYWMSPYSCNLFRALHNVREAVPTKRVICRSVAVISSANRRLTEAVPSGANCHRRFQQWVRSGVMRGLLEALALDLKIRGVLDIKEAFIDGSFAPAKKGAPRSGRQNVIREQKSWRLQTAMVSPLPYVSRALPLTK
jgi:hypothetical protein